MLEDSTSFNYSNSVHSYDGLYYKPYKFNDWSADILKATSEYENSIPYQKGIIRETFAENWMLFLLLFCFMNLAFVRGIYRKRFSMLFQTFINWKLSKQIIRYEKVYTHPVNLLLLLNFIICVPLFFTVSTIQFNNWNISSIKLFILILFPLLFYLLIKFLLYQFSAWLLKETEAINEYLFQTNLFNKYLGVVFLILTTFLVYSSISSYFLYHVGVTIFLFFLGFQIIRGIIIGIQRAKNLLLIILYLCTLEILPWLVLGKWLNNL